MKFVDLTGMTLGDMTVIKRIEDRVYTSGSKEPMYLCQCSCGNTLKLEGRALKKNKKCDCKKDNFDEDLTKYKFSRLQPIKQINKNTWECICDCGNTKITTRSKLIHNQVKSCGCLKHEHNQYFKDLTGMKFGRLNVISLDESNKSKHAKWICKCECGKTLAVFATSLLSGKQVSCGCYRNEQLSNRNHEIKGNKYNLSGEYGIGYASNSNKKFMFDLEDYEKIKKYTWNENAQGYIVTQSKRKPILMHRLVMGLTSANEDIVVDHIYHNTCDNRKQNLRVATYSQNQMNTNPVTSSNSGRRGVFKKQNKYYAKITVDGEVIKLGSFDNFSDAVHAREIAEKKYFGEYVYQEEIDK